MNTSEDAVFDQVCAVSMRLNTRDSEGTCSGILIDPKQGLVLTHASLLYPLLDKIGEEKLTRLLQQGTADHQFLSGPVKINIFLPNGNGGVVDTVNGNSGVVDAVLTNDKPFHMVNSLSTSSQEIRQFATIKGKLKKVFVCKRLRDTLTRQMPSDTWQFVEDITLPSTKSEQDLKLKSKNEDICYRLLPFFIVIKLLDHYSTENVLEIRDSVENKPGDLVEICATPFGSMSPEVFLNARSRGIISKLAGPRGVLQMTDARCIPGCEGGALFYCHKGKRMLTGIMIASLCWKNNEWVGLSLGCAIGEVLGSMKAHINLDVQTQPALDYTDQSFVSSITEMVPCINVGHNWGSGVVLDGSRGLILTCSHVLNAVSNVRGSVDVDGNPYSIVYKTPARSQFDVAIIKSSSVPSADGSSKPIIFAKAVEGEVVYVVGHAVFRGGQGQLPLVTRGIVSKVIRYNKVPIMIQTSCAVHAGASGGGVFNTRGQLVAMVVCNSRDSLSGASYPHVNMCVPMETIASVIKEYLQTEDTSILKSLYVRNNIVRKVWSIGTEDNEGLSCL